MPVQLKIRDIRTGTTQVAELDNVDDAEAWLRERPSFVEVLGPARPGLLSPEDDQRLRGAIRPMDPEEKAAQEALDERDMAAVREMIAKEQQMAQADLESRKLANRSADPNRLVHVVWERGKGCRPGDPTDDRPITDAMKAAVKAWVAERDTWVHPRGQYLVDAQVMVWPGEIPNGGAEDERVERGGQFNTLHGTPPELN